MISICYILHKLDLDIFFLIFFIFENVFLMSLIVVYQFNT